MPISNNFPTIRPSLLLDFANTKQLDPRITFSRPTTARYYDEKSTVVAEQNLLLQSATPYPSPWIWTNGYIGSFGSELVTNGNFSSATGWSGNTEIITGGVASFVALAPGAQIYQNILTVGKRYKLVLVVSRFVAAGVFRVRLGGSGAGDLNLNITGVGTYTVTSVATADPTFNLVNYTTGCNFDVDSVSVVEVVQNLVAAPDGTSTASTLISEAANTTFTQSVTVAGDYTFSVYLRRVSGTGNIDITAHSGDTWVTQTITSSWARYTVTQTLTAGARTPGIRIVTSGDQVEVWGAQLEQRSTATAYNLTTTAAITNYIPVLLTQQANESRFDHNPVTRESLGLLIEEQRTNLLTWSEDFTQTPWTAAGFIGTNITKNVTVAPSTVIAPNGTQTASAVVLNNGQSGNPNNAMVARYIGNIGGNVDNTVSLYIKNAGIDVVRLYFGNGQASPETNLATAVQYTFSTSTATLIPGNIGVNSLISAQAVGNGWVRITLTRIAGHNPAGTAQLWLTFTTAATGNGFSGVYIWGAQLEAGAFATSYIPTVVSQVTRSADSASMTGANFSSWYNQAEGTLYGESTPVTTSGAFRAIASIADATNSETNFISIGTDASNSRSLVFLNGGAQANITTGTIVVNTSFKQVLTYKTNDVAYSFNGGTVQTDASVVLPTPIQLFFGQSAANNISRFTGTIKKFAYYPARVTNAQLQGVTTV